MFITMLTYVKPLTEVEKYLAEHVQFLEEYYDKKKFICSGRKNPRTGGVILMNVDSRDEVEQILREDPFHKNQIAEYEVIEFLPTKYDPRFACFAE